MNWTEDIEVFNEDCMVTMSRYEDNYFDLAIVDPPYGININENIGRRKGQKHSGFKKADWDNSIPDKNYFIELKRVSKNQIIWGGNYMTEFLEPSPCWVIWDKGFSEDVSFAQFEMAWSSFKSSAKKYHRNPSQKNKIHPTQKPISLYLWIYKRFAEKGDKILDTHFGSGSNGIALDSMNKVENMELTLVACEIDKDYYNESRKRFEKEAAQMSIFTV